MSTDTPTQKLCAICGLDVSARPRSRDSRGRYLCQECLRRAQEAQQAKDSRTRTVTAPAGSPAPAPDPNDNAFLLDMGSRPVPAGMVPCPSCTKPIKAGAVLCVNCGYNSVKGEQLHVQVLKPVEVKQPKGVSRSEAMARMKGPSDRGPMILGILGLAISGGLSAGLYFSLQSGAIGTALVCQGGLWLYGLLLFVLLIKESLDQGLLCVLGVIFLPFYDLYFAVFRADSTSLKWLVVGRYLAWAGLILGQAMARAE